MRSARNIAVYFPFLEFTRVSSIATVLWFGSQRISEGTLSVGELVALLFYLNYFFDPLIQLSFNYDTLRSAGSSMKKVFSIHHDFVYILVECSEESCWLVKK